MPQSQSVDEPREGLFSPLLEAAIRLAARGHHDHFRKGTDDELRPGGVSGPLPENRVPYITHLMGTMCILARTGATDRVLAAGLLHDYLEDVPDPDGEATIRAVAGDEVLELVLAVTERKPPDRDDADTWEERKREQVARLATIPLDAVLIRCADMLHNLESLLDDLDAAAPEFDVWSRFNAGPERQLWYSEGVLAACRERLGPQPLVVALERAVERLRRRAGTI